jgi:hypothetical protein
MQAIYNYVPETIHVSSIQHGVAAKHWLQSTVHVMISTLVTNVVYFYINISELCVQCPI